MAYEEALFKGKGACAPMRSIYVPAAHLTIATQPLEIAADDVAQQRDLAMPSRAPAHASLVASHETLPEGSLRVPQAPPRTACGWGLSAAELERWNGSLHHLRRTGRQLALITAGETLFRLSEPEARKTLSAIGYRITDEQKREGLPPYWVRVMEAQGGIHGHTVAVVTRALRERLVRSEALAPFIGGPGGVEPVRDLDHVEKYLAKERPPNVRGGARFGRRLPGSHPLGQSGGDRIILSGALRRDAIAAGLVQPYTVTRARFRL